MSRFSEFVARSRFAPLASFGLRLQAVAVFNSKMMGRSLRWVFSSREHTNYTYDLTALNRSHLAWFVAVVTGREVTEILGYFEELEGDDSLRGTIVASIDSSDRSRLTDREIRWHKRLGWYAVVRALKPVHVVETGTDKGLGAMVLAAALDKNGDGRVTTIDVNPGSGSLISGQYSHYIDRYHLDSIEALKNVDSVDLFIHDSLHTRDHEMAEYLTVCTRLTRSAIVLTDNGHVTNALPEWARATDRRFLYWQERPDAHWYPGGGIGVAW